MFPVDKDKDRIDLSVQTLSWPMVLVDLKGHVETDEEGGFSVARENLIDFGAVTPETGIIQARTQLFTVVVNSDVRHEAKKSLGRHGEMFFQF